MLFVLTPLILKTPNTVQARGDELACDWKISKVFIEKAFDIV